jgi:hypothetical protein
MTHPLLPANTELSEIEKAAHEEWLAENKPPLPLATALKLYELFLNFYTVDEIYRINAQKIPLGKLVDARVRFQWDKRRKEQIDSMYSNIEQKVLRVKNEAVVHITDLLAAAHKVMGDKIKLFLQDGDPATLGDLNVTNFKHYKELVELLKTLTEKKEAPSKDVRVDGVVSHIHSVKPLPDTDKITSSTASDILKLLDKEKTI